MITAFYISTALLALLLLLIICFESFYGHEINDAALRLRRWSFVAFFSCGLVATASRFFTVSHGQIELLPTMTISLDYCSFVTFCMLAAAYFGRQYYKNPYNWFFMLELPIVIIIINTTMRLTGGYSHFYSLEEMLVVRPDRAGRMILMSRFVILVLTFMSYIFLSLLLLEAYIHHRRTRSERMSELESRQNLYEHANILLYVLILLLTVGTNFFNTAPPHILCNVLMMIMITWSAITYKRFVNYARMKKNGSFTAAVIEDELQRIVLMEYGNPFLETNPTLDNVASVLEVSREDLSDYIYNRLGMSFSAWISEKKLLFCAHLLVTTDRLISDIALSAGYMNVTAMNKAFKTRFGKTPSQYRQEKGFVAKLNIARKEKSC